MRTRALRVLLLPLDRPLCSLGLSDPTRLKQSHLPDTGAEGVCLQRKSRAAPQRRGLLPGTRGAPWEPRGSRTLLWTLRRMAHPLGASLQTHGPTPWGRTQGPARRSPFPGGSEAHGPELQTAWHPEAAAAQSGHPACALRDTEAGSLPCLGGAGDGRWPWGPKRTGPTAAGPHLRGYRRPAG